MYVIYVSANAIINLYIHICYQHCYHVKMNSIAISIPTSNENLVGKISIIFLARNQNQLWNGIIQRRIVAIYLIRVQSLFCHVLMMYVPCMGSLTSLWNLMSDFLLVCWLLAPKFIRSGSYTFMLLSEDFFCRLCIRVLSLILLFTH